MEPLKKLLSVTPKVLILLEVALLVSLLALGSSTFLDHNFYSIKLVLNVALASVIMAIVNTHFQIRHSPYLLIQECSPYELIRTQSGITLLRCLIIYIAFSEISYLQWLILLVRNICLASSFFAFISFSFSLNSKIQFVSTRNGKLNLNYIIQATLLLAAIIAVVASSYSSSILILNFFGFFIVAIMTYIGQKVLQSLRIKFLTHFHPLLIFVSLSFGLWSTLGIVSSLRIPLAKSPIEVSLWQGFYFSNIADSMDLKKSFYFTKVRRLPCKNYFPPSLELSCRDYLKQEFMSTDLPDTTHPEFYTLIRFDYEFIQKFAYYYLKTNKRPVTLSNLWERWLMEEADLEKLKEIVESSDTAATSLTDYVVKSTPKRPELATYISAEIISRFADTKYVKSTLAHFFHDKETFESRLDVWNGWNKISAENLLPSRLPATEKNIEPKGETQ